MRQAEVRGQSLRHALHDVAQKVLTGRLPGHEHGACEERMIHGDRGPFLHVQDQRMIIVRKHGLMHDRLQHTEVHHHAFIRGTWCAKATGHRHLQHVGVAMDMPARAGIPTQGMRHLEGEALMDP